MTPFLAYSSSSFAGGGGGGDTYYRKIRNTKVSPHLPGFLFFSRITYVNAKCFKNGWLLFTSNVLISYRAHNLSYFNVAHRYCTSANSFATQFNPSTPFHTVSDLMAHLLVFLCSSYESLRTECCQILITDRNPVLSITLAQWRDLPCKIPRGHTQHRFLSQLLIESETPDFKIWFVSRFIFSFLTM